MGRGRRRKEDWKHGVPCRLLSAHAPFIECVNQLINRRIDRSIKQVVIYEREGLKPLSEAQRRVFDFVVVRAWRLDDWEGGDGTGIGDGIEGHGGRGRED